MADRQEQQETGQEPVGEAAVQTRGAQMVEKDVARAARSVNTRRDLYDEDEYTPDEYEAMLEMYEDTLTNIEEGEIVKAQVLRVTDNAVILDVGFKSEGAVTKDEFKNPEQLQPGDEVEVFLENLEDEDGVVVLSKKKADFLRVWEKIKEAHEKDQKVPGVLVRKIKGGVTVDLMGVDAFLPGSQIALRRVPNIEDLIGQTYDFKIIKLNKRRRNIVVSRRVILESEREEKRELLVKELLVGQVRRGAVKNVTDFGAFIDLGGLDGLLHITDMSWGRVGHPSEIVSIGADMDVKVLDIDWNRERISLGLKQLLPYPWKDVQRKYPVGVRVRGRVVSITNYGAFIELEKGIEGLVHISEMSWTRNVRHPSKLVSIGDEIEAVVLKVDRDDEKISLGMKQIEEDPWLALPLKYPTGTRVAGKVRNLTSFGAFVEIEPGIDGLIHISDMSWTKRVEHPSEVLRKSDDVEVVVLGVDAENKRISLGLKQTEDDPWAQLSESFAPGVETGGTVVRTLDKGVVVDLGEDVEGFVPVSHLGIENVEDPADHLREGQALDLRVIESDAANRRIVLSVVHIHEYEGEETAESEAESITTEEEAEAAAAAEAPEAAAEGVATEEAEAPSAEEVETPSAEAAEAPGAEAEVPSAEPAEAPASEETAAAMADQAAEEPVASAPETPSAEAETPVADAVSESAPAAEEAAPASEEPTAGAAAEEPTSAATNAAEAPAAGEAEEAEAPEAEEEREGVEAEEAEEPAADANQAK